MIRALLAAALMLGMTAPARAESIYAALGRRADLSDYRFIMLQASDLLNLGAAGVTVLAPVNGAFGTPRGQILLHQFRGEGSMQVPDLRHVKAALGNQLVPGAIQASALTDGRTMRAASGAEIVVHRDQDGLGFSLAGGMVARLAGEPIVCDGGIIYPVGALLSP